MVNVKLLVWTLLLLPSLTFCQRTIMVKEGDSTKMVCGSPGYCFFKEKLPDGHYISYRNNDTLNLDKEITFLHGKKNGLESRYYYDGVHKYLEINWVNGKKNGPQIHFGGNGNITYCMEYHFLFRNNIIDGPFFINSICVKSYSGFYKNGYRDSIWTYYDNDNTLDTSKYWRSKEYKYVNGVPFLVFAWNKQGMQTITNGAGTITDTNDYIVLKTNYMNGLKNGSQVETRINGGLSNIKVYKDNLLMKEISYTELRSDTSTFLKTGPGLGYSYPANSYLSAISEWAYPHPPKITRQKQWVDTYITDIYYTQIVRDYTAIREGHWSAYFPGGITAFEGEYKNDKRTGNWNWFYPNGKQRMKVDYSKKSYQHFDSLGIEMNYFNKEYLTLLTQKTWNLRLPVNIDTIQDLKLEEEHKFGDFSYSFQLDGSIRLNQESDSYKDWHYELSEDHLNIIIPNFRDGGIKKVLHFRIVSANEKRIKLTRID
jgi:antitoxin component YwqK of YwqJK toxin-antitoxin module